METNHIFLTGYAKLPQGITAKELYAVIAVGVVIDIKTSEIVDADCTLATALAKSVVKNLLVGSKLNDLDKIEKGFKNHYYGSARKAILSAIKTCNEKYRQILDGADEIIED
ncbi:MAG: hypothetical protein BGO41_07095 [Clostridiales bacterium 38-18]|nr:MAG: hypothetical protein BGO41_07095 [Clostridiales bacterium 38-18]